MSSKYVWVVTSLDNLSRPRVDKYVLFGRKNTDHMVRVEHRGKRYWVRKAKGRHFFYSEVEAAGFCREWLKCKIAALEDGLVKAKRYLAEGVPVNSMPAEDPHDGAQI